MIVAHGIDLVAVERVGALLERHGSRARDRLFTAAEQAWAEAGGRLRNERYAGRFAAKEAVAKALGTGIGQAVEWVDIEVLAAPTGAPQLSLYRGGAKRAEEIGAASWLVSISHTEGLAMASVIGSAAVGPASSSRP